jgi:hypothetical protein
MVVSPLFIGSAGGGAGATTGAGSGVGCICAASSFFPQLRSPRTINSKSVFFIRNS